MPGLLVWAVNVVAENPELTVLGEEDKRTLAWQRLRNSGVKGDPTLHP
jgi:hypothetical protein